VGAEEAVAAGEFDDLCDPIAFHVHLPAGRSG
jgi:hypothetical protein